MSQDEFRWSIRTMRADELPLLRNSLFLSARDATDAIRRMGRGYSRWMATFTDDLLATFPDLIVAEVDDVVLGYAIGVPTDDRYVCMYVYVKRDYRKAGVARDLVASLRSRADGRPLVAGIVPDRFAALAAKYADDRCDPEDAIDA